MYHSSSKINFDKAKLLNHATFHNQCNQISETDEKNLPAYLCTFSPKNPDLATHAYN